MALVGEPPIDGRQESITSKVARRKTGAKRLTGDGPPLPKVEYEASRIDAQRHGPGWLRAILVVPATTLAALGVGSGSTRKLEGIGGCVASGVAPKYVQQADGVHVNHEAAKKPMVMTLTEFFTITERKEKFKTSPRLEAEGLHEGAGRVEEEGHDAVEDGLVQQKEIEKELDETFSDRRLLVEAEALDPSSLGIQRKEPPEAAGAVGYSEANVGGDPAERAAERVLFGGPPTKRAL
ncbi:unnamed protein product [Durusdinium trenchii]|uniref:Uncharacterized protein n=1 Tax=Durusdinium trenchii TaxID=1381693 RepID=A0ABP0IDJ3_9DINO